MRFWWRRRERSDRLLSARAKRRHPCERGAPHEGEVVRALRWLLDGHTWRRHPAPFNKTRRSAMRRVERRFMQHSYPTGDDE